MKYFLLVLFFLTVSTATARATDYYFNSATGSDNNNGTSTSTPWKSAAKINTLDLNAGDNLYFQSGQSFPVAAKLYLQNNDSGTATNPVTFTTYGGSNPAIFNVSSSDDAIYGYNVSGLRINNLTLIGPGNATADTVVGILIYTTSGPQSSLKIDKVDVSKFGRGIVIGSGNGAQHSDISVTNALVHDNTFDGMLTFSASTPVLNNVYVGYSRFYNNTGKAGLNKNSGSGLIAGGVNGGVIEHNVAYNNGALADAGEGPVGIWAYQANNVNFQYNTSYSNRTGGPADGGGFDLDGGVTNSIMQYNYAYDNDGACLGVYQYSGAGEWKDNIFRYNICQNNARKNGYGEVTFWNNSTGIANAQFYNNTFYTSPTSNTSPAVVTYLTTNATSSLIMRNNIFYTTDTSPFVYDPYGQSGSTFQSNDYFNNSGKFIMKWNKTDYSGFSAWQTASSQEKLNGANVGLTVDPMLVSMGATGADNYKLKSGSPLIDKGVTGSGSQDYFGGKVPQGSAPDIGANEFGVAVSSVLPSPTPASSVACMGADLNNDNVVNTMDDSILLNDLLKTIPANPKSDINKDGIVDIIDYSLMSKVFGLTCQ